MEQWDLFDKNRRPLGRTHRRGTALTPGEYHTVVEIWTVNANKEILLTLRDPQKESYPLKWENTGGSALAGETSVTAALRELQEETGLIAAPKDLTLLATTLGKTAFHDTYILYKSAPLSALTLQPGETIAAQWVTANQLEAMIEDESLARPIGRRYHQIKSDFTAFVSRLSSLS